MADPKDESQRQETSELETNFEDPGPDIESSQSPSGGRTLHGGSKGAGRVTFGGDLEREQASELSKQIMRSTKHQLETASEQVESIRWVETDGSKHIEDPNQLAITEFELNLTSGKRIHIEGPVMNMKLS